MNGTRITHLITLPATVLVLAIGITAATPIARRDRRPIKFVRPSGRCSVLLLTATHTARARCSLLTCSRST